MCKCIYTNPGFCLPSLKRKDGIYPGQNRDVRKVLRNLIGLLENWELENTDLKYKKSKPRIGVLYTYMHHSASSTTTHEHPV